MRTRIDRHVHFVTGDFNQQLDMAMEGAPTVFDIDSLHDLTGRRVRSDAHCYGCTAGAGSSCGGALAA